MEEGRQRKDSETAVENGFEKLSQPEKSHIGCTIAVMSGKGGVGKSSISALLAVALNRQGYRVGLLDADITGPSIPKLFGLHHHAVIMNDKMIPSNSNLGIKIISLNLLLPHEDDPVVWRGPLIGGAVKQFWTDVMWGELDYMIVDLPPGTGDAPLTVLQSLPLDGLVIVSSPQDLAVMVVKKAIKMARMMKVPIVGLIENMSSMACPHCGEAIEIFGISKAEEVARVTGLKLLGRLPLDPELSRLGDRGAVEDYPVELFNNITDRFNEMAKKAN